MILRLAAEGKSQRSIARELGTDPKTVRAVLKPRVKRKEARPSVLDTFRPLVRKLVLEDELTAVRVLEELKAVGYPGSYSILKVYIRTFRPKSKRRPHLRFETAPGVQAQVDLSTYTVLLGATSTKVTCFSMVFGFSRWQFIRFLLHADARSVSHCHVLAFEEAGGVPTEILYDRMKQVVLESYKDGVLFHPLFERLVAHYGFTAIPLAPGYCEGKGKVEQPFGFVENNFLQGRVFHDFADLNRQAKQWRDEKAGRDHRTTHEQPAARLDQERPVLTALPDKRFDAAQLEPRLVGDDFCVAWETNRYSVSPLHVGKEAWVRVLEGELEVLIGEEPVVLHRLQETRFRRYILPEHEAEFRGHSTSRHVLAEQFKRLGSGAEVFAAGLREAKGAAAGYHMSLILKLAEKLDDVPRVIEAMRHAARYGAFDAHAVARIATGRRLKTRTKTLEPGPGATEKPPELLKGEGSFQRDLKAYERLAREQSPTEKESEDGHRGDGSPDRAAEETGPAPRRPKPR